MATVSATPGPDAALGLRLREMAARAGEEAARKRDPGISHQAPTARRARIAEGMTRQAEGLERLQRALLGLAQALELGTLPRVLQGVRTRVGVETVLAGYYPTLRLSREEVQHLLLVAAAAPTASRRRVAALLKKVDKEGWVQIPEEALADVRVLLQVGGPRTESTRRLLEERLKLLKRLAEAGIPSREAFEEARMHLDGLAQDPNPRPTKDPTLAALERDLLAATIPGYFPTPAELVAQLLDHAALRPGLRVLEPSAGKGNIADALARIEGLHVDVAEIVPRLRRILELKGHRLVASDFLDYTHAGYDRIIMNPPFEKFQDVTHILHAYDLLAPGGRLVSIVGASAFFHTGRKAVEFRDWLNAQGAYHEKLPEGSFRKAERRTGVSAYLVVVNKPSS